MERPGSNRSEAEERRPDNRRRRARLLIAGAFAMLFVLAGIAAGQMRLRDRPPGGDWNPEAEFRMVRVIYRTTCCAGSHGVAQPWWAIDYPYAEQHFFDALRRITNVSVADDSVHIELSDKRIFKYPFLFLQAPGAGNWRPTIEEAANLREYLLRGGFLLVDDFHGEYEWSIFQAAMQRVFPDRPIIEIPQNDAVWHVFFDLNERTQIPGDRHLRGGRNGQTVVQMQGPPHWRGIYDDHGHLMVAINFNIDMGDGWEHADDPYYPVPMTKSAYEIGVNYVIYAMTH